MSEHPSDASAIATVRRVDYGDAGALAEFRALLREYDAALLPQLRLRDAEGELRELERRYPAPDAALFLARIAGKAIGCIAVRPIDAGTAEIKRLFVRPAARGTGTGRALVEAAIAFARERGAARLVLDTHATELQSAYRLYVALGFVPCEAYETAEYDDPTYLELRLGEGRSLA